MLPSLHGLRLEQATCSVDGPLTDDVVENIVSLIWPAEFNFTLRLNLMQSNKYRLSAYINIPHTDEVNDTEWEPVHVPVPQAMAIALEEYAATEHERYLVRCLPGNRGCEMTRQVREDGAELGRWKNGLPVQNNFGEEMRDVIPQPLIEAMKRLGTNMRFGSQLHRRMQVALFSTLRSYGPTIVRELQRFEHDDEIIRRARQLRNYMSGVLQDSYWGLHFLGFEQGEFNDDSEQTTKAVDEVVIHSRFRVSYTNEKIDPWELSKILTEAAEHDAASRHTQVHKSANGSSNTGRARGARVRPKLHSGKR